MIFFIRSVCRNGEFLPGSHLPQFLSLCMTTLLTCHPYLTPVTPRQPTRLTTTNAVKINKPEYSVNTCLGTACHGSNWSVARCSQKGIYSLWLLIDFSSVCCSLSRWLSLDNRCVPTPKDLWIIVVYDPLWLSPLLSERTITVRVQGRVVQLVGHLTHKSDVLGSIVGLVSPSADSRRAVVYNWRKYVHEVLVNRLGGLSLPRKSVVRLTDRPDMTLDVYRGRKTTTQQQQQYCESCNWYIVTQRYLVSWESYLTQLNSSRTRLNQSKLYCRFLLHVSHGIDSARKKVKATM